MYEDVFVSVGAVRYAYVPHTVLGVSGGNMRGHLTDYSTPAIHKLAREIRDTLNKEYKSKPLDTCFIEEISANLSQQFNGKYSVALYADAYTISEEGYVWNVFPMTNVRRKESNSMNYVAIPYVYARFDYFGMTDLLMFGKRV